MTKQLHVPISYLRPSLMARAFCLCYLTAACSLPAIADAAYGQNVAALPAASVTAAPPAVEITPALPTGSTFITKPAAAAAFEKAPGAALSSEISNFEVVSNELWRGAQPSHKAIAKLAQNGVKTIVDLRYAGGGCEDEAHVAQRNGIKYINIPLGFEHMTLDNVAKFMAIVCQADNQPVFVHCRQGADRTGTMVGVFRMIHDHWTFARTYEEMRSHHFKPFLNNMKSLVARCGKDPAFSKEISDMAAKMEHQPVLQVSAKPTGTSL